ncbi:kelch-like protein 35 [Arctopsyche grandis]|uniref:kelch-like protein 35 n=1 Tax=Arctopsyche grandis TaxID=121162 RepID=UPI00406D6915
MEKCFHCPTDYLHNFVNIYKSPDFLQLNVSEVVSILQSNDLNAPCEEDVFFAMKLWIEFDKSCRQQFLFTVLSCVRLTLLSVEFLTGEVLPYCSCCSECVMIITKAMQLIVSPNFQSNEQRGGSCGGPAGVGPPNISSDTKMIIVGSWEDAGRNFIETYSAAQNSWSVSRDYGFNRRNYSVALVNNRILIIGGYINRAGVATVDYVDITSGQKFGMSPLKIGRYNAASATISRGSSSDVYLIGGLTSPGRTLNSVERWNSDSQSWVSNVPGMLQPLHAHAASVVDGRIYVTGGSLANKVTVNTVQMYSPETNSWSYRTPMNSSRFCHLSAVIRGRIFVVGGCGVYYNAATVMSNVEAYDPNSNSWTSITSLPSPRTGGNVCLFQNRIVFIGGRAPNGYVSEVMEYDDGNGSWNSLGRINIPREGTYPFLVPQNAVF